MTTLYVAVGGTLGVLARYGIGRATLHHESLLWSTVAINVVGSFLLGLLVAEHWFDRDLREGLGVGFLGGFTTYSSFNQETLALFASGATGAAALNVAITLAGGVLSWASVTIASSSASGITPEGSWTLTGDLVIADGATFHGGGHSAGPGGCTAAWGLEPDAISLGRSGKCVECGSAIAPWFTTCRPCSAPAGRSGGVVAGQRRQPRADASFPHSPLAPEGRPEAVATAPMPPSSAAMRSSSTATVGFEMRE